MCSLGALCCVCGVLGHLAPVYQCARSVHCVAFAVSWAPWLLCTGVPASCVVLGVRCPGPLGSCSPVCPLGTLSCMRGVLGDFAPVHRCDRPWCCVVRAVSWATWLSFTGVLAWRVVLRVRCSGPLGSCSPVCPLGALCCVCGVLGHLVPVHRCARWVCSAVCAMSWANWLLVGGLHSPCGVLRVRCRGPLGSCLPVCSLGVLCRVCGVLGNLAPVHRCVRSVCCVACAVRWATSLLFTGAHARCVVLCVRCPGPLCSCLPACTLRVLCCVCGVLGHSAPVHRCAPSACCVECEVSWATWLLFTDVPARRGVLFVVCAVTWATWLLFSGLPWVCCGVCARRRGRARTRPSGLRLFCNRQGLCTLGGYPDGGAVCAVSWATWLLFNGVPAWRVVLRVRCPGPLGSCSPVCPLGALCCVCGVLGHLVPVHRCARWVCSAVCAMSWATWLLFGGLHAPCVVLRVRCRGPLGSCSPVCSLGVLCRVCGVLGSLAPFLPMCTVGVLCCACGVLGCLAYVHRCARSVCCAVCAVSWATWLLFTSVYDQGGMASILMKTRCAYPPWGQTFPQLGPLTGPDQLGSTRLGRVTIPLSVLRMSVCVSLLSRAWLPSTAFSDVGPKVLVRYPYHSYGAQSLCRCLTFG